MILRNGFEEASNRICSEIFHFFFNLLIQTNKDQPSILKTSFMDSSCPIERFLYPQKQVSMPSNQTHGNLSWRNSLQKGKRKTDFAHGTFTQGCVTKYEKTWSDVYTERVSMIHVKHKTQMQGNKAKICTNNVGKSKYPRTQKKSKLWSQNQHQHRMKNWAL